MEQVIETTGAKQVREKISFEEYLKKYSGVHAEWIGGEVVWLWQTPLPKVLTVARALGLLTA